MLIIGLFISYSLGRNKRKRQREQEHKQLLREELTKQLLQELSQHRESITRKKSNSFQKQRIFDESEDKPENIITNRV